MELPGMRIIESDAMPRNTIALIETRTNALPIERDGDWIVQRVEMTAVLKGIIRLGDAAD